MGEKYCIVMICLILKQKISWCVKPICQSAKSTNEQNKCFKRKKKDSSALVFLEEAADFGCRITLSNGHSSWRLLLTESVDKLIRRLSHFKIIPKSSSNCFYRFCFSLLVFCFLKLQTKVRSPTSSSENSFVTELLSVCRTPAVLCSSSVSSFQEGRYLQHSHYLYPLELAHADELL